MAVTLRIATFNVENLFSRPRLLNLRSHEMGNCKLALLHELQEELSQYRYDKRRIHRLYRELKTYIRIVEDRGRLFGLRQGERRVVARGRTDWDGWIALKRDKFNDAARHHTARVIEETKADVVCLAEVEDRVALQDFSRQHLWRRTRRRGRRYKELLYPYNMLIDGNDPRGIDVGLLSRLPVREVRSHIFDRRGRPYIFSRDCLEVQLIHPRGFSLWVLLNHFKSRGGGRPAENDKRRRLQARRVAQILKQRYDLRKDLVVVAGDLNDTPKRSPLRPLLRVPNLHDVLEATFPDPADRWTYHYNRNEQIDYLLVSRPLLEALHSAGVERRGIFGVDEMTGGKVRAFGSIKKYKDSASDHGAVWAQFRL